MKRGPATLAGLAIGLAILACTALSPQGKPQTESTPTIGAAASDTPAAAESNAAGTATPAATEAAAGATIPPLLTSIPGIVATLTAVFSTPGAANTLVAEQTMAAGTQAVQLGGLSSSLLSQCPNPADSPMQSWEDVPVMPQATAGQVVQNLVGSYYCFRAPVTVAEMEAFYKERLSAPRWVLQSDANGSMEFIGMSQGGFQLLILVSGPGNQNDLIVAINVTNPMNIPTPKP